MHATARIRNFSIIAHIDHGKSTLADRMLEATNTIEKRRMKEQVLDSMELERERGITIKMQPVRMRYAYSHGPGPEEEYVLNLIDTPGHIDFSYEVSRALTAVEGSLLLVDATQGVQAQTLTTLSLARELGRTIIPVVTKIDSPLARAEEVAREAAELLGCPYDDVLRVSGRTGEGVGLLLKEIVRRIPSPTESSPQAGVNTPRGLVFDFEYSDHRGIIVYLRMMDGVVRKGDSLCFASSKQKFSVLEAGIFDPEPSERQELALGEIGYIVTGIKQPGTAIVGDTIIDSRSSVSPLPGYREPHPVVWASIYPESEDDFTSLRQSLLRLKLTDPALSFEEESSGSLGRGFRCGFLGMLHLEIVMERLKREFKLDLILTTPSIIYEAEYVDGRREKIYSPAQFPDDGVAKTIYEQWVRGSIILPPQATGAVMQLLYDHEAEVGNAALFGEERTSLQFSMPLRELMRNFFDELKRVSSGFASLSYELAPLREADVVRLDILVADEPVAAFSRIVSRKKAQHEAEFAAERLSQILPRQLFAVKIQGKALGRILSSRTISALRKDVTGYLYGGDITRKMKLREKQKRGKKKMKERGKVSIPHDVFLKMMKRDDS